MPYKVIGKTVYIFRRGQWKKFKEHKSVTAAHAHKKAMEENVKHKR